MQLTKTRYNISNKAINNAHWLAIFSMFFMNRVAAALLVSSVFYIAHRKGCFYHSSFILPIVLIAIFELLLIYFLGYNPGKCIQQLLLISIFVLSYEQLFKSARLEVDTLFYKYVKLSYYISIFGLVQELVYVLTKVNVCEYMVGAHLTQPLFNYFIRVTSTLSEGGYLGTILIPALIYLLYYNDSAHILGRGKYVILIAGLLTMSPFFYVAIIIIVSVKLYKRARAVKYVVGLIIIGVLISGFIAIREKEVAKESGGIDGIIMRITDSFDLFMMISGNQLFEMSQYNVSTATLGTSLYIGIYAPSRFIGSGIGTQEQNHDRVAGQILRGDEPFAELNKEDGYSLLTRILSEWGLVGVVLYVLFLYHFFNKNNRINVSVFFILLCFSLRGGSYVDWGTTFWHFCYIYTSKSFISKRLLLKYFLITHIMIRIRKQLISSHSWKYLS